MSTTQKNATVHCAWGAEGLAQSLAISDVVIIVDVLSFSTCIDVAVSRDAIVYPCPHHETVARNVAKTLNARLAGRRGESRFSLSPRSLLSIPRQTKLVLSSPNGSTLSLACGSIPVLAGCLRNCRAVALAAANLGERITVIPAGERVGDNSGERASWRPALEDLLGAGAIIYFLQSKNSPSAQATETCFHQTRNDLQAHLADCCSGQELISWGFSEDVRIAGEIDVSDTVPQLQNGAYRRWVS